MNLFHYGPFCALSPPWQPRKSKFWKIEKKIWRYYIITLHCYWDTTMTDLIFVFHFGLILHFYAPNNPKNENFYKMKTMFRYIILYMCTKNYDHMMYSSWDMVHKGWTDRWTVFSTINYLLKVSALKYGLWLYSSQI